MTEIKLHDKIFKMFINQGDIENKIDEIATKINNDFKNKCPVILCVLKGSYMFFSDLTKKLNIDCTVSFIQIKSYENTSSTGKIKEVMGLNDSINSKDVIIIEDIIDTGTTYNFLIIIVLLRTITNIENIKNHVNPQCSIYFLLSSRISFLNVCNTAFNS